MLERDEMQGRAALTMPDGRVFTVIMWGDVWMIWNKPPGEHGSMVGQVPVNDYLALKCWTYSYKDVLDT